jgi:hypothetical protein
MMSMITWTGATGYETTFEDLDSEQPAMQGTKGRGCQLQRQNWCVSVSPGSE